MGMFDSVYIPCPHCGKNNEFQTKSGDCSLDNYSFYRSSADPESIEEVVKIGLRGTGFGLPSAPDEVLEGVWGMHPDRCECGCLYRVDKKARRIVNLDVQEALDLLISESLAICLLHPNKIIRDRAEELNKEENV